MIILELPLTSIEVGNDRARDLDPVWAEGLAALIDAQGLQHPIRVRAIGETYQLVAGLHRLEAHRLLGRDTVPALLSEAATEQDARMEEVMENLGRYDLIALDRCHHLYEMKQLWEAKYPHTANGKHESRGNQYADGRSRNPASSSDEPEVFGFVRTVAETIGLGKTQIKQAVKIWSGLAPSTRDRLRGTDLARKQTELKALSELPASKQAKVLDAIFDETLLDVGNVAQAIEYLDGGAAVDPLEKRFQSVSRTISALDDTTFDSVISAHEDRIIASLKRRGRI